VEKFHKDEVRELFSTGRLWDNKSGSSVGAPGLVELFDAVLMRS
jgi:hypothetical protein